jgi:hypothetical protein
LHKSRLFQRSFPSAFLCSVSHISSSVYLAHIASRHCRPTSSARGTPTRHARTRHSPSLSPPQSRPSYLNLPLSRHSGFTPSSFPSGTPSPSSQSGRDI